MLQSDVPGRTFLLQAKRIGSLNLGSPILFRDLEVGEILGWDVGEMARDITVHVFVRAPFDQYVHDNSRFWNASGASVQLGANGVQFKVESLRAVVLGGVAFETPDDPKSTAESQADHAGARARAPRCKGPAGRREGCAAGRAGRENGGADQGKVALLSSGGARH